MRLIKHADKVRRESAGFTLVEALVTAAVAAVVLVVVITLLLMNNQGVSMGSVNSRVQSQYESAAERIGYFTRIANVLLAGGTETWNNNNPITGAVRSSRIEMYGANGTLLHGFCSQGTSPNFTLYEYDAATPFPGNPFRVGQNTVQIIGQGAGKDLFFGLSWNRREDTLLFYVKSSNLQQTDSTQIRKEVFTCKN